MVKIRLMRVGKKKQPSYRVVVADSRSPRDGRIIEAIGQYHPREDPSVIEIDNDRAVYWLQQGAQPSSQVRNLLGLSGAWTAFTGEAAPAATTAPSRATAAASVKATPAASVVDDREPAEAAAEAPVKATPAASVVDDREPAEQANADEAEQEMPTIEDTPTEGGAGEGAVEVVPPESDE